MKPWYKSKTIWFNAIAMSLIAMEAVFHVLQPLLGPVIYPVALVAITAINGFLRVITSQGIVRGKS